MWRHWARTPFSCLRHPPPTSRSSTFSTSSTSLLRPPSHATLRNGVCGSRMQSVSGLALWTLSLVCCRTTSPLVPARKVYVWALTYRALSWFSCLAGVSALQQQLQPGLAKSFLSATTPSERRESLPLPLSFVAWLERSVCQLRPRLRFFSVARCSRAPGPHCAGLMLCGFPLPAYNYLPEQSALVCTATRTKTTTRAMPFGLLNCGLSGTASQNWATKYLSVLRQAVSDTLQDQPDQLDFLPAILSSSPDRPRISRPMPTA